MQTSLELSPGKPVTCLKSRAVQRVDKEGEKREAWANATSSAGDAERRAALANAKLAEGNVWRASLCVGDSVVGKKPGGGMVRCQSRDSG